MSRLLIALMILAGAVQAQANNYVKYIDCGNGSVVMDRHYASYRPSGIFQLVIRDQEAIESLLKAQAIPQRRLNDKGELIISLTLAPQYLPTFIYDGHDSYQENGNAGVVYIVRPKGETLELQSFTRGPDWRGKDSIGLWTFNSCR